MDRDPLHEIYRRWRAIADSYAEPRVLVGEVWLPDAERFARYLRPDELHTAFNFDFLACPWEPGPMRASIDVGARRARSGGRAGDLGALEPRRDAARHALRPRRHVVRVRVEARGHARPTSSAARGARGRRRCSRWRCPARCTSTRARSSACRRSRTSRPTGARTRCGTARAASTPVATAAGFRFRGRATGRRTGSAADGADRPWLDQPDDWAPLTVAAAVRRGVDARPLPRRAAPAPRRPVVGDGALRWLPSADSVLAFARGERFACLVNFGPDPVELPAGADVLIASNELEGGALPQDTTVWLRQANGQSTATRDRSTWTAPDPSSGAQEREGR